MIIDFKAQQIQCFLAVLTQLQENPELYQFSDVSAFFQAEWRQTLPLAVNYVVSGLDDGGGDFSIYMSLYGHEVRIDCNMICTLCYRAVLD